MDWRVDLLLELCRGGTPAEVRLVEKVFSREALERLASAGLVAVEGGVVKPLACRGGGGRLVFPPAHMGYVVVPWLKKALGASPPLAVADARLKGRLEVEAVYVSDLGEREFYYSPYLGFSVCSVEQCYADILTFGEPGPYLVDLVWSRGLYDVDKVYELAGERGRRILAALVVWDMVLTGRSVSWGRFDPYREEFEEWLDYVAKWATWAILDDGGVDRLSI